jgi:hypothetical protein
MNIHAALLSRVTTGAALTVIGAMVLSGCTAVPDEAAPPDRADLARFYDQKLDFGSCQGEAGDGSVIMEHRGPEHAAPAAVRKLPAAPARPLRPR